MSSNPKKQWFLAAQSGNVEILKQQQFFTVKNEQNETALMIAIKHSRIDAVKYLIEAENNPEILQFAKLYQNQQIISLIESQNKMEHQKTRTNQGQQKEGQNFINNLWAVIGCSLGAIIAIFSMKK
ncbi:Ankyrin_repeat protein 1 [Hexamita inflata]|uniref:Ankyrin_repeat protein 1 n=1 Tax=Hexamita inflata TaxID=28002 RepID=A0ABP1GII9_9EUKA